MLVKQCRTRCVTCFRTHPVAQPRRMADLPAARVTPAPPFDRTAIDYLGPVLMRSDNARPRAVKGALLLFSFALQPRQFTWNA